MELAKVVQRGAHVRGLRTRWVRLRVIDRDFEVPPARDLARPLGDWRIWAGEHRTVREVKRPERLDAAVAVNVHRHRALRYYVSIGHLVIGFDAPSIGQDGGPCAECVIA